MAKLSTTIRDYFWCTAAPALLWSDGGPQFTSHQFTDFLQSWGVSHVTSSPHYPQSNGKAEATVKSMKKLISAAWTGHSQLDQLSHALLQYRNTPCQKDGLLPAQELFGHPVHSGYSSYPLSILCTRMAEIQSRSRFSHHTYIKNIPGHL